MSKNNANSETWELGRETKYFNGTFKKARLARGWRQQDVGDQLGVSGCAVSAWETLKHYPPKQYWKKLEDMFGMKIDQLFPEFINVLKESGYVTRKEEYAELQYAELEAARGITNMIGGGNETAEQAMAQKYCKGELHKALEKLSEREQRLIKMRFGLDGERPHTLYEAANEFSVTRERIQQIEQRAFRKLRHLPAVKNVREEAELAYGWIGRDEK